MRALFAMLVLLGGTAGAQVRLPFFVGETLTYRVKVARVGASGRTTMIVDTPQVVQGTTTWPLRFDFRARVGPMSAVDRTESWLDPDALASLRFHKHERHPLSKHDEREELTPAQHALDELSFMYFLRTLPLDGDSAVRFTRHFDAARNPTVVRVIGRDTVATTAGTFRVVHVEMRVQDPRRYRGEGVIRIDLTDDHCRIPVRIESEMPLIGRAVMTLDAENHPAAHHLARIP